MYGVREADGRAPRSRCDDMHSSESVAPRHSAPTAPQGCGDRCDRAAIAGARSRRRPPARQPGENKPMAAIRGSTDATVARNAYLDARRSVAWPTVHARRVLSNSETTVETVRELNEVGVFRALRPFVGGLELHPATFFESIAPGSACGSTGCLLACCGASVEVGLLAEQARSLGENAHAVVVLVRAYVRSSLVKGGYRLGAVEVLQRSGSCDWAILEHSEVRRADQAFLVRGTDFAVDYGSWQVTGLAGTEARCGISRGYVPSTGVTRSWMGPWHRPRVGGTTGRSTTCRGWPVFHAIAPWLSSNGGAWAAVEQIRTRVPPMAAPVATSPAVSSARLRTG
jgi:hypothetical protein